MTKFSKENKEPPQFSDEAYDNFAALWDILKRIHIRLVKEGYTITDDEIIPPSDK